MDSLNYVFADKRIQNNLYKQVLKWYNKKPLDLITIDEFRVYAKLLNWRSKDDYNDLFDFSKEDVRPMMEPTKHFINKIASLIEIP